jgi:hypothetical protein
VKKLFFVVALVFCTIIEALPLTNIADPSLYECSAFRNFLDYGLTFRSGYWGDFVFNREAKQQVVGDFYKKSKSLSIDTNAGYFALNYCNWIELFGSAGETDFQYTLVDPLQVVTLFPAVSWSAGLRGSWRYCNWIFGAEGQYFQAKHSSAYSTNICSGIVSYFNHSASGTYREWQGGLGLAYQIESYENFDFVPYLGVRFADFRDLFSLGTTKYHFAADKFVGYAAGASLLFGHALGVTAEGRYGDEVGLFVNGQFRF